MKEYSRCIIEKPPSIFRDRVTKPIAQIGFIKYVLLPLFEALCKVRFTKLTKELNYLFKLYPEVEEISLEHLRQALTHYEKKKDLDERRKKFLTDPESELETIEAH